MKALVVAHPTRYACWLLLTPTAVFFVQDGAEDEAKDGDHEDMVENDESFQRSGISSGMLEALRQSNMFAPKGSPLVAEELPESKAVELALSTVESAPKKKPFRLLTGTSVASALNDGLTMLPTPTVARVMAQNKKLPPVDAATDHEVKQLVRDVIQATKWVPFRMDKVVAKGERRPQNRPPVDIICRRRGFNWHQKRFVQLATFRFLFRLISCYRLTPQQKQDITVTFSPYFDFFFGQLFYLGGKAGSGKSKCIKALIEFVQRWDALQHLVVCGTSGLAACLLPYGQTRHSANSVGIMWRDVQDPPMEVIQAWQPVFMKVIDECSMMAASEWFEENERCKQMKKEFTKPFGGIDIIPTGDFSQLEAVRKASVWVRKQDLKHDAMDSAAGIDIFQDAMTACVLLHNSYRQVDLEWEKDLDALCEGPFTKTHLEHFQLLDVTKYPKPMGPNTTLICYVNAQRQALTRLRHILKCKTLAVKMPIKQDEVKAPGGWRARGVLRVDAGLVGKRPVQGHPLGYLPRSFKHYMSHVCDEKHMNDMPGSLALVIGEKFIITEKIDNEVGLAKNMWVVLVDISVREDKVKWDATALTHNVSAMFVHHVIVKLNFKPWSKLVIHPPMPKGMALILPNRRNMTVTLPSGKRIALVFTQLPLVTAEVITGHKAEGMTLAECLTFGMSQAPATWFYVAATRTPSRETTHLAEAPPINLKRYEQPLAMRLFRKKLQILDYEHQNKWAAATKTKSPEKALNVGKIELEMYDLNCKLELMRLARWHKRQLDMASQKKKAEQWPLKKKTKGGKSKVSTLLLVCLHNSV